MKIDVVIPNYNGSRLLEKNLPKVVGAIGKGNSKIIIVDDASEEGDYQKVLALVNNLNDKSKTKIILLRNEENMGFSSAVDRGVEKSSADLIFLLNSDAVPEENFLEPILSDFDNDKELFGVGCMDKSIDKEGVVLRGRGVAIFEKGLIIHSRGEVDSSDTFWISGGSSVVRRKIFLHLGGLDPIFDPFYWEDIDLSYRARKSGHEIKFNSKSIVEHRHLEGVIKKHFTEKQVKAIAYRNQFVFIWKNITDAEFIFRHIFWLPYHIFFALIRFDIPFFRGLIFAIMKLPVIIQKRSVQKKLYKKSDQELFR